METLGTRSEEIIKTNGAQLSGNEVPGNHRVSSNKDAPDWIYKVDKSTDDWVITVSAPYAIRVHTDASRYYPYMDHNLQPRTQQLVVFPGQWCEMYRMEIWAYMVDADHREPTPQDNIQ